jgi:hypothetical protein
LSCCCRFHIAFFLPPPSSRVTPWNALGAYSNCCFFSQDASWPIGLKASILLFVWVNTSHFLRKGALTGTATEGSILAIDLPEIHSHTFRSGCSHSLTRMGWIAMETTVWGSSPLEVITIFEREQRGRGGIRNVNFRRGQSCFVELLPHLEMVLLSSVTPFLQRSSSPMGRTISGIFCMLNPATSERVKMTQ